MNEVKCSEESTGIVHLHFIWVYGIIVSLQRELARFLFILGVNVFPLTFRKQFFLFLLCEITSLSKNFYRLNKIAEMNVFTANR